MFTKIHEEIWDSLKEKEVSDNGKLLFIYLFSCKHRNIIGLYKLPQEYISADLGQPIRKVKQTVKELFEKGLIIYDEKSTIVFLKGFLEHNPLQNAKMEQGAMAVFKGLPGNSLLEDFHTVLKQLPKQYQTLIDAVEDTVSEQYGDSIGTVGGKI